MRRVISTLLTLVSLLAVTERPAPAQTFVQLQRSALGAGVGVAGGAGITMAIVVARARWQREYLDSADDLIHWQSLPMIAAPAAGVVFGLAGRDALAGSIVGSTSGMLAGAAIGAGLGWLLSDMQEWPWAGAVIGGGFGMTLGGLAGGLIAWQRDEDADLEPPNLVEIGFTIPVR